MTQKTPYFSHIAGRLPRGCQLCVQGSKLVLFVTGLCSRKCYYCPLSDVKRNKDDIWANEWKIKETNDIITEAKLCNAQGAGLTGGDPILRINRTISLIKLLKNNFGKEFHIHLYTPTNLVTEEKLKKLYKAGLDEIRFHPDIENSKDWSKIELAKKFNWSLGVEIPVIPGKAKETKRLIDYLSRINIDFLNLNELEISDTNANKLLEKGFKTKDNISYAIKGSEQLALKLLKYAENKIRNIHYCTAKLKDKVQLANRIKRRAKNIARDYDIINLDGILKRGAIYLEELKPGFGYRKKLESLNKNSIKKFNSKLNKIKKQLTDRFHIPDNLINIDEDKLRILIDLKILHHLKEQIKSKGLIPAVVEEYPTHDQLELSVDFL
ncbi:radical SAM protein [Candidatus Woesearchaeota archaeon]|nr:radical SAM protein [Candidatus Woesearchaeota archaeon]